MNQADYGVKIKDIFNKFIFNKIHFKYNGKIVDTGTHDQLLINSSSYCQLLSGYSKSYKPESNL